MALEPKHRNFWAQLFSGLMIIIGAAMILSAITPALIRWIQPDFVAQLHRSADGPLYTSSDTIQQIIDDVVDLRVRINDLSEIAPEAAVNSQLTDLRTRLDGLAAKITAIDSALQGSSERVLSLPIMRRDLEALGVDLRGDVTNLRGEIDRVYAQNQWFIGLMVTMVIALAGLLYTNFRKGSSNGS